MDQIDIQILHDKYFSLIDQKVQLETTLATTKYPNKVNIELKKLDHIIDFNDYIIDGSHLVIKIKDEEDESMKLIYYNQYLTLYFPNLKINFNSLKIKEIENCEICSGNLTVDKINCISVCVLCGHFMNYTIQRHTWDVERMYSSSKPSYEKIKTMMEWMNLFLGRETKDLEEDIVERVRERLKRMKREHITVEIIKKALKELKLNKKYKYKYYLYAKITGIYPILERETELKIYQYFSKIQETFNRFKSQNIIKRKNIWVYRYCVYKICEIIGETELLDFIPKPLVDSNKNLHEYDVGWGLIMKELDLPFKRTI